MRKKRLFVCYDHEDMMWCDDDSDHRFIPWLEDQLTNRADFWYDRRLDHHPHEWEQEIFEQIDTADAAILLVSQDFLTSKFICEEELPRIRKRTQRDEMIVIPILVGPVIWDEVPAFIRARQMLPGGQKDPLLDYTTSLPGFQKVRVEILDAIKHRLWPPGHPHDVVITRDPIGDANPVAPGGTVRCSVSARDSLGHDLCYEWSADAGSFDDDTSATPAWTAPESPGAYQITVRVTCAKDSSLSETASFAQTVAVHEVTITRGPTGDPNPVAPGGTVQCSVSARDSLRHDLCYEWSADDGSFDDDTSATPTWTAPATRGDFTITVNVTCEDDDTPSDRASWEQRVGRSRLRQMGLLWGAVGLVVAAVVLVAAYAWWPRERIVNNGDRDQVVFHSEIEVEPPAPSHSLQEANVPDVVGQSFDRAQRELERRDLRGVRSSEARHSTAPGTIISQKPQSGELIAVGATVELTVSLGPDPVTVGEDIERLYQGVARVLTDHEASNQPWEDWRKTHGSNRASWMRYVKQHYDDLIARNRVLVADYRSIAAEARALHVPASAPASFSEMLDILARGCDAGAERCELSTGLIRRNHAGEGGGWERDTPYGRVKLAHEALLGETGPVGGRARSHYENSFRPDLQQLKR